MIKTLTILGLILSFSLAGVAQSGDRAALTAEMATLNKSISKLERGVSKSEGKLRSAEKASREGELKKSNAENAVILKIEAIEAQKADIGSFNLEGLESQIKRQEADAKRTESDIVKANTQIAKKKSQIELLYSEITTLENEVIKDQEIVVETNDEISATRETIESNGLVSKEEKLNLLENDLKKLVAEDEKLLKVITREKSTIEKTNIELKNQQSDLSVAKTRLKEKKAALDKLNGQ